MRIKHGARPVGELFVHLGAMRKSMRTSDLPIATLLFALAIIRAAYVVTFADGLIGPDVLGVTPPISVLMCTGRGRLIGQFGFPLVALAFLVCSGALFRGLPSLGVPADGALAVNVAWLKWTGRAGFLGLGALGALPLQRNMALVMRGEAGLTADSVVHQLAAALFFLSCALHMGGWLRFATCAPAGSALHYRASPLSFGFKAACFAFSLFPLPTAFLLHPASPVLADAGRHVYSQLVGLTRARPTHRCARTSR